MNKILQYKRTIAFFFLSVLGTQLAVPATSYALTSGPTQPEVNGFEPVSTAEMVDLFSGDFTYNLPLMEVGGYPLNLAYHSGSGMDDEASWVGLGWSLNPGTINRQMRGLPDDFNGDKVEKDYNMKDNYTYGLKLVASPEVFGKGWNVNFNLGVFRNSYRGMGAEVGADASIGLTQSGSGSLTAGLSSNSQTGVDLSAGVNFAMDTKRLENQDYLPGMSVGLSYNSRAGIKGLTLGASANAKKDNKGNKKMAEVAGKSSFFSFAGETYTPSANVAFNNQAYTFSGSLGGVAFGIHGKVGFSGYYNKQSVAQKHTSRSAYGFMNAERGAKDINALMDFNREKDIPYFDGVSYLPVPVATQDLFSVANQETGGQYRLYRNGSGVFFDPKTSDQSIAASLGVEVGAGGYFQLGVDLYGSSMNTRSNKWQKNNAYLNKGDFQSAGNNEPAFEPAYFKKTGEQTMSDAAYNNRLMNKRAVGVHISRNGETTRAHEQFDMAMDPATGKRPVMDVGSSIRRAQRDRRKQVFSYLTAKEASNYALDPEIRNYPSGTLIIPHYNEGLVQRTSRVNANAKAHHISEVTITEENGKRFIYGIPAYNTSQEDATFAVPGGSGDPVTGLVSYNTTDASAQNKQGRDNYFSREKMPAYAHSYLLTGMLSDDYVDVTGDGISDDDIGSAVRFNYSKLSADAGWRTPYAPGKANLNEGMLSDKQDDKGSYSYGTKEIWNLHSIESKTMVALFVTGERQDALGVQGSTGTQQTAVKQRYLEKIELYSKSDLLQHPGTATPVKTVHFEYDYSSCPNVPNNSGAAVNVNGNNVNAQKGKLTLKKVYYTFGKNKKGYLHPYKFSYNLQAKGNTVSYGYKQSDRWGTYKNNATNENGLRNDEFPYATQDKENADAFAGLWQMSRIDLPSGGAIQVNYESDDYGYVQNRRAQQMCFVSGIGGSGSNKGLIDASVIYVKLPKAVQSLEEMKFRYFKDITQLYYKWYIDLDNNGHYEYVPGYAKIRSVRMVDGQTAAIEVEKTDGANPIAKAAWQYLRLSLPQYAYPGYETNSEPSDAVAAIKSLVTAIGQVATFIENFDVTARRKKFGDKVDLQRCWVRLCSPDIKKLGGGSRVKSIRMSDNWQQISGSNAQSATYGQDYSYTTTDIDQNGKSIVISSGVAAYEPMIGSDENPFRQPIAYTKKGAPLGLNNYYYLEEPFGESYFPAPDVGYSRVEMRMIGADNSNNRQGYVVNEFYTAKDFPVSVEKLPMVSEVHKPNALLKFLQVKVKTAVALSQGYAITTNDMHGKPKSETVYNRGGSKISSNTYQYKTENPLAPVKKLTNEVMTLAADGSLQHGTVGENIELFTDMREQMTQNIGGTLKLSFGTFPAFIFPFFYIFPGPGTSLEYREFRSTGTVKLVQQCGVLDKVTKMVNGSSVTTENVAWDAETGDVLLMRSQNEFDDPVYSLNYPAHWAYDGMGMSYKNIGVLLKGFTTNTSGNITSTVPSGVLVPGDELADVNNSSKGWVMKGSNGALKVIDKTGNFLVFNNASVKVIRSGKRNKPGHPVGSIVSLRNPIKGGKLDVSDWTQIIETKANTFKEEWQIPLKDQTCSSCPTGYQLSEDGSFCYKYNTQPATFLGDTLPICRSPWTTYGTEGTLIYNPGYTLEGNGTYEQIDVNNTFWRNTTTTVNNGPLNRVGVWTCNSYAPINEWVGFSVKVNVLDSKMYYIGMAGDNQIRFSVNGQVILQQDALNLDPIFPAWGQEAAFRYWHVYPVTLTAGENVITVEGYNLGSPGSFGVEIYDNTPAELKVATSEADLKYVFSSKDMVGKYFQTGGSTTGYGCPSGYFLDASTQPYSCRQLVKEPVSTTGPSTQIINPYVTGLLGNWRPWQQIAYNVNRAQNPHWANSAEGATDIRRSGAYSSFTPYWNWMYNPTAMRYLLTGNQTDNRWVTATEVTKYNQKGVDIESKDALNMYAAVQFGYLQSVPVAVGGNARYNEIGYDGFEDYGFALDRNIVNDSAYMIQDSCNIEGHFDFRKQILRNNWPVSGIAHSGKYSMKATAPIEISRKIYSDDQIGALYTYDAAGHAVITGYTNLRGFYPLPQHRYMASLWVKGAGISANTTDILQVYINGSTSPLASSQQAGPVIDGWRKVDLVFTVPANATSMRLVLKPTGGTTYFDDVRVQPYQSQMKSFVYNSSNMFLMAELDDNNYATFYEYDDEGTLIRTKKETERGIMTVSETRGTQRKQ